MQSVPLCFWQFPRWSQNSRTEGPQNSPALAWLACLLCPALAWSGLGLSCLPCLGLVQQQQQRRRSRRRPPKAAGCCCWTRPRQGRHDRPRPDQAKARHDRQASQAKADPDKPELVRQDHKTSLDRDSSETTLCRAQPVAPPAPGLRGISGIEVLGRNAGMASWG